MKRGQLVLVAVAAVALVAAAAALAQPTSSAGSDVAAAKSPKLPPLPAAVKARQRWVVGVKCDVPPFGYIDVRGKNAGFDVEVARTFAKFAFGKASRVNFTCVTTPDR